ncbi:hypothetical protein RUM43_008705 [Polyplax serrata]|uniref:MAGUK p55 subfamily member 6 n=1 Tax=Polyplax serrata TaxID=468196 RepID=A0AAN8P9P7_POLSC
MAATVLLNSSRRDGRQTDGLYSRKWAWPTRQAQDKLEEKSESSGPLSTGNINLINDINKYCQKVIDLDAQELVSILSKPHFKSLLGTHDSIAERYNFPSSPDLAPLAEIDSIDLYPNGTAMTADAIRVIGLRKNPNEPLGLTVEEDENGNLVVARILAGGMIDKQALLSKGDIILEVNGIAVTSPEDLITEIAKSRDTVTLKIAPSFDDTSAITGLQNGKVVNGYGGNGINTMVYMRALFDYNPKVDTLLPCKEIGLEFQKGDVLQILNQNDPNWWQAKKVGWNEPTGLIPSQELEERRKAFVIPDHDFVHKISMCGTRISKKKRKILYQTKTNSEFDKAELLLYEEVTRMPPFKRKTLVLIGCHGVGRRTLKNRIINSDPNKFGGITPITSRPRREYEENGKTYWFMDRDDMEQDIREHKFLEYGEHNNHLYGTSLDSIRDVIKQGKMCVLDCNPTALKILHNSSEFMPYVVFIAAPGMEQLKHLYYENRPLGTSSRNLTFDRQSSIRYSSRRARTLESLASIYEEDDLRRTLEESSCMQRTYDKYIDLTIVNEDFDVTFRKVIEALDKMSTEHQWVPVNWVY